MAEESIKIISEVTEPTWKTRTGKEVPMSEMTTAQLIRAKKYAQSRILHYHNLASSFDLRVEQLEEIAAARGEELPDYDREFFKNQRILEQSKSK